MKFSNSLKFNAVPEWQDLYINYPSLKKLIYALQEKQLSDSNEQESEIINKRKYDRILKKFLYRKKKNQEDEGSSGNSSAGDSNNNSVELKIFKKKDDAHFSTLDRDDSESTFSIHSNDIFNPSKIFLESLEKELIKIDAFYKSKEEEIFVQHDQLVKELTSSSIHLRDTMNNFNENKSILSRKSSIHRDIIHSMNSFNYDIETQEQANANDEDDEEDFEDDPNTALLNSKDVSDDSQKLISFKKRATFLFVSLSELKSFIELNRIGFTKISKKFDKELDCEVKRDLIDSDEFFKDSYVFQHSTITSLDERINDTVEYYANLTSANIEALRTELRSYLREHIVWERTTVWKDMLNLEEGVATSKIGDELTLRLLLDIETYDFKLPFDIKVKNFELHYFKIPKCFFTRRTFKLAIIIAVTGILLGVKTFHDLQQHRCMALLACVALLWATELIPLFATAMLVPLLVVTFQVLKADDGSLMAPQLLSRYILNTMWSSTIMLLLGGFTLAGALSKYNIAKVLLSFILSAAGTNPKIIILAIMFVLTFLSMWISNVAAPVLCFSLMQGLIKSQPTGSPFTQLLLLSIAFASNIGGMASPISSPQNMVAIEYMDPSPGWGKWFGVGIPVAILADLLVWGLVISTFNVKSAKIKLYKPITDRFTLKQMYISVVTLGTILLWCLLTKIPGLGEAGQISIIPFILFFGTGLLNAQDLNNFPWGIVVLAMGGIALGSLVSSSGLLSLIATSLQHRIQDYPIYAIMMIFGILILVVATFVSHTVLVLIIVPLVKEVGDSLPQPHPTLLVFTTTLIASAAMALPTSGFPNVTAISMTDEVGRPYLQVSTFITRGIPASLLLYIVIISIGYGIMSSFNF